MPAVTLKNSDLAAKYQCGKRTITRLRKAGVEVSDPEAVAAALANQKNISRTMAAAVLLQLETTKPR